MVFFGLNTPGFKDPIPFGIPITYGGGGGEGSFQEPQNDINFMSSLSSSPNFKPCPRTTRKGKKKRSLAGEIAAAIKGCKLKQCCVGGIAPSAGPALYDHIVLGTTGCSMPAARPRPNTVTPPSHGEWKHLLQRGARAYKPE